MIFSFLKLRTIHKSRSKEKQQKREANCGDEKDDKQDQINVNSSAVFIWAL